VLVTGAASGVGFALSSAYADAGARVVMADNDGGRLRAAAATVPRAEALELDVTDADALAAAAARFDDLDILVNNAIVAADGDFLDTPPARFRHEIDVDLVGPMLAVQAFLPGMLRRGGGAIVNISSVNALLHLGNEAYSAAKAGLHSFSRAIATQYGGQGVRSNVIALGTMDTPYWEARRAASPDVLERVERWYPVRSIGKGSDAAAAAMFLTSDGSRWITGATLVVDGGLTAGNQPMTDDIHS
jgi:NAD(P)-dependent dehydrogenase (short-subunit alcohol dehydrogenase family)